MAGSSIASGTLPRMRISSRDELISRFDVEFCVQSSGACCRRVQQQALVRVTSSSRRPLLLLRGSAGRKS